MKGAPANDPYWNKLISSYTDTETAEIQIVTYGVNKVQATMTQDHLNTYRDYTVQLPTQLTEIYPILKAEMAQSSDQYLGTDEDFSFLEELELWLISICGYAEQVQKSGQVEQSANAINHLKQLQIFANPIFVRFHAEAKKNYPELQNYLQTLDYLRLLTLEYLQMQQQLQPLSA